jgi:hypothetical protein
MLRIIRLSTVHSQVTTLYQAFQQATVFNQDLSSWNVASVSNMGLALNLVTAFNQDISGWNTARVQSMQSLFKATTFNHNVASWNVASVTNLVNVFYSDTSFNQNLAGWNVLRVSLMGNAFLDATGLSDCNKEKLYSNWGATLRATYPTWSSATCTCTVGAQTTVCLTNTNIGAAVTAWGTNPTTAAAYYGPISSWDVSAVSCMLQLFYNKPTFNADISKWNVASVSTMAEMFQ